MSVTLCLLMFLLQLQRTDSIKKFSWQIIGPLSVWPTGWITDSLPGWLTDPLANCFTSIDGFTDWPTDRLTDWPTDLQRLDWALSFLRMFQSESMLNKRPHQPASPTLTRMGGTYVRSLNVLLKLGQASFWPCADYSGTHPVVGALVFNY